MDYIEVSAKTVDDAITKASIELGLSSDQLEYQVISQGSTGFLGIGSKPAVIQVRRKSDPEAPAEAADPDKDIVQEADQTSEDQKAFSENNKEAGSSKKENKKRREKKTASGSQKEAGSNAADTAEDQPEVHMHSGKQIVTERSEEEIAAMKSSARAFLESVFKAMELPVDIEMEYDQESGCLNINFEGEDMGILIGKRGQTLDSLQYLTSLVVNKDQKNYVRVKLDTEDYRKRRKDTLENLARNIAYKVKRNRRPVSLEAMNPYERRIIHSALQGNKYVETHSEGNEPYRHVVVTPKRNGY